MKKTLAILLILLLGIPALSHAGSATSRWDMSIGGFVKFDLGYNSTSAMGADINKAPAEPISGCENIAYDYGNLFWAGGETRLNFNIKGPDAWGGKTSAFIEGDFVGLTKRVRPVSGEKGVTSYGTYTLRHAYFKINWPKTELLIGHTWQPWGRDGYRNVVGRKLNDYLKGYRYPQVRLTQKLAKEWTAVFAVASPHNALDGVGSAADPSDDERSLWPDISLEVKYQTDRWGKIGSQQLLFALGGVYGKQKTTFPVGTCCVDDETLDRWGIAFYGHIPIIPEKKNNKAGSLGLSGNVHWGQGVYTQLVYSLGAYDSYGTDKTVGEGKGGSGYNTDPKFPPVFGFHAQLTYYLTDKLFANAIYGYESNSISQDYEDNMAVSYNSSKNFILNLMYDVNPAVRLGLEYARVMTDYTKTQKDYASKNKGKADVIRFGAWYFF